MQLYIARHGETEYNAKRLFQGGGIDTPLTKKGREQAEVLKQVISEISFDAVYSSPLKRAMDTACIAFGNDNLFEPESGGASTDLRLAEIGMGEAEGMPWDTAGLSFMTDPSNYVPPVGGEDLKDMISRVDSFLQDLSKKPYKKVFVMAHGIVLRVVYACSVNKSPKDMLNAPEIGNCALHRYSFDNKNGKWILTTSS